MLPLLERRQRDAQSYLARSIELDPQISSLARLVSEDPANFSLVLPIRAAIDEAIREIHKHDEYWAKPGAHSLGVHFDELKNLSHVFRKCKATLADSDRKAKEGNNIVQRWDIMLAKP